MSAPAFAKNLVIRFNVSAKIKGKSKTKMRQDAYNRYAEKRTKQKNRKGKNNASWEVKYLSRLLNINAFLITIFNTIKKRI